MILGPCVISSWDEFYVYMYYILWKTVRIEVYLKIKTGIFLGQYSNGYIWLWNKICKNEGICIIFSLAGMSGINEGEDVLNLWQVKN